MLQISEEASVHHMTIENLATVFAPTIFRDYVPEQKPGKKSRHGSQEDLLYEIKRKNELKVLVIQVLIENAEKIGVPKDCYKATRRPSDLKKKERGLIASSVQKNKRLRSEKETSPDIVPEDPILVKPTMLTPVKSSPVNTEKLFNRPNDLRFLLEVVGRPSITQIQGSGIVHKRIEQFTNKESDSE
ncbi:hypothetical protein FO519_009052 [Halicephalobus sp. NKZ332]|nr:hypothetical protein FO519_009052 [Halicephalobus sp. NKZ332]